MRQFGLPASIGVHAVLLLAAVVSLPGVKPLEPPPEETLNVEVITPQEFQALTRGEKTAKPAEKPARRVDKVAVEEPLPDDPLPVPKPNAVAPPKRDTVAAKAEATAPEIVPLPPTPVERPVVPEPKPEPKPDPKPEPKPNPDAAKLDELALRATQEPDPTPPTKEPDPTPPTKEPDPVKKVEKPAEPAKPAEVAKVDPPKPDATKKAAETKPATSGTEKAGKDTKTAKADDKKAEFDLDKIAALLDKDKPARKERSGDKTETVASLGSQTGNASKLTLSQRNALVGAIMNHVSPCWSPPAFSADARNLSVVVLVDLTKAGTLAAEPEVLQFPAIKGGGAAALAAKRAVMRCITTETPLQLPPELFGSWRAIELNFDPRDMAGG